MNRVVVPAEPVGPLPDAWRECVGTGRFEPRAARATTRSPLALVQREIGFRLHPRPRAARRRHGHHRPYEYQGVALRYAFTYVDQVIDA